VVKRRFGLEYSLTGSPTVPQQPAPPRKTKATVFEDEKPSLWNRVFGERETASAQRYVAPIAASTSIFDWITGSRSQSSYLQQQPTIKYAKDLGLSDFGEFSIFSLIRSILPYLIAFTVIYVTYRTCARAVGLVTSLGGLRGGAAAPVRPPRQPFISRLGGGLGSMFPFGSSFFGGGDGVAPPAYDDAINHRNFPSSQPKYTTRTTTSSVEQPAANSGPGFFSGMAAGSALGYMFGGRGSNQRQQQQPVRVNTQRRVVYDDEDEPVAATTRTRATRVANNANAQPVVQQSETTRSTAYGTTRRR